MQTSSRPHFLLFLGLPALFVPLLAAGCGPTPVRTNLAVPMAPAVALRRPAGKRPPAPAATYTNPVIDRNFPDPSLLRDGGAYYAYATNDVQNVLCARSTDLVHWTRLPDALPQLPRWARPDRTWAPEVQTVIPGSRYVAYFAAWDTATNREAIGTAVASSPAGPFVPAAGSSPLVSDEDSGGAIDPTTFQNTDGTRYLIWKNDGNAVGQDTWLWLQKLSADGLSLIGEPAKLMKEDQPWEGSLVEAPTLCRHGSKYYLFYSANNYSNCSYAVGYAVADSVAGPYTKPLSAPWLASADGVCGPGGEEVITARDSSTWMAYHTWAKGPGSYRAMSLDKLTWKGDVPVLLGPSRTPKPAPL